MYLLKVKHLHEKFILDKNDKTTRYIFNLTLIQVQLLLISVPQSLKYVLFSLAVGTSTMFNS